MDNIPNIFFRKNKFTENGFEVINLQSLLKRTKISQFQLRELHRIKFYQLVLLTKGKMKHVVDFVEYDITDGNLLCVTKGQVQSFAEDHGQDGFVLLFTDQFLNKCLSERDYFVFYRFFTLSSNPPVIQFDEKSLKELIPIFKSLELEFNRDTDFAKTEIIRSFLKVILLSAERIVRNFIEEPESVEFKSFVRFQEALTEHYRFSRDAKFYASHLNMSYRHLNNLCKEFTQKTAKAVIDSFVILEAKRQLFQFELSIKEVSYLLGFDEPTNFVKYFKTQTGMSPKSFRNQLMK